jgi:hypothetical protein
MHMWTDLWVVEEGPEGRPRAYSMWAPDAETLGGLGGMKRVVSEACEYQNLCRTWIKRIFARFLPDLCTLVLIWSEFWAQLT